LLPSSTYILVLISFPTRRSSDLTKEGVIFFLKEPLDNLLDLQREYQRFVQKMAKNNQLTIAEWQLLQRIADGKNSQELLAEDLQIGRAHVRTPVTFRSRMPSSA